MGVKASLRNQAKTKSTRTTEAKLSKITEKQTIDYCYFNKARK